MSGWWAQAVCGGLGELFFGPDNEEPEARDAREARAIAICRPCPVRQPCLEDALSRQSQAGVAGGVGEERRKALRHAWLKRQRRQEGRAA
ncbi:MAG TPA: WhiB family transcriptional regulator [Streptosporangiaceae bacterium]|nr:WhiB family transcriptional regulator [Streptosporangiaceae bacterium]